MSVMTAGKPRGLTRAGAPARRPAGAASRGQPARPPRPERRPTDQPGAGVARHLRAVPEVIRAPGTQAVPGGQDGAGVRGVPAVPHPRRPGQTGRAEDLRGTRQAGRARDARLAPPRNTVRLTRRGRIVVGVLLTAATLLLAALAWMAVAARAQAADGGLPPGAVYQNLTSVVVHPGQTLWSIAAQAEPSADPRVVMQEIVDLNALQGSSIEPGQRLWVPRG
jgi:nucleoid-associated protein YgaU